MDIKKVIGIVKKIEAEMLLSTERKYREFANNEYDLGLENSDPTIPTELRMEDGERIIEEILEEFERYDHSEEIDIVWRDGYIKAVRDILKGLNSL